MHGWLFVAITASIAHAACLMVMVEPVSSVAGQRGDHSPRLLCRHEKLGRRSGIVAPVAAVVAAVVVHLVALGEWAGLEPSKVEPAVAAQEEHEAALSSKVGWARISPFVVELLQLGTVKTLMAVVTMAVAV